MWRISFPGGEEHRDTLSDAIERELFLIALGYPKALVSVEWIDVGAASAEYTNY